MARCYDVMEKPGVEPGTFSTQHVLWKHDAKKMSYR
jgi:hypothetical protein